ncbi:cation:proton antiporter [bacterium]|nr:cation:proton antiporter [bacterium]
MSEFLGEIISGVSLQHLNILFLLGLALFGGTIGGQLFQKLRIPQVVGYIAIGILIGESGFKIVNQDTIQALQPFNYFALGLIGFMVGGELKKEVLAKYGKQFVTILLFEGITPFLLVTVFVGVIGTFLFKDWKLAWSLGLLLGAIASATDPATTTQVIREYKTRGPLTKILIGIVALDDGLALLLFVLASSIAGSLTGKHQMTLWMKLLHTLYEIGGSVLVGVITGWILKKIVTKYAERGRLLAYSIGTVLLVTGLSIVLKIELLLAAMTAGIILINSRSRKGKILFDLVEQFTPPIYVLFFVLIGAKLNISHLSGVSLAIVGVYLVGTLSGKTIGSHFGGIISKAPATVRKYLPFGLFSQAGVAIGLSILAAQYFPGDIGNTLVIVITATTFITQLIGPYCCKVALTKADEVGLDITEEDIIAQSKAKDVMDPNIPLINENQTLPQVLSKFSETDNLFYPVIDEENRLLGVITIENIKDAFSSFELGSLILAHDLMEPVTSVTHPETPLFDVKEAIDRQALEFIPVVSEDNMVLGIIETRNLQRQISSRILELRKQADMLG